MRKFLFLLLILIVPNTVYAQQVIRGGVSAFSDNETNRTFTTTLSITDTSNVLFTKTFDVGVMEADDSIGNYNYQFVRIGFNHNDGSNNIFIANVGAQRLYSSIAGERYQPIGYFAMGVSPAWSTSNPFGVIVYGQYAAFDEIGQYIRADIQTTSIGSVGEVYVHQKLWIQGVVDKSFLSDDNERFTVDLTARYFTTSGWFYGTRGYYRTYKNDMGTIYWSPNQYSQLVGQGGYRFLWNDPKWQGNVTFSAGIQKQDSFDPNFLGSVVADISRRVSPKVWIRGWGGYSNGLAIAGDNDGYRAWTLGVGVRIAR